MCNYLVDNGLRIEAHVAHAYVSTRNVSSHKQDSSTGILLRKPHVPAEFNSYNLYSSVTSSGVLIKLLESL
jgi:hypothetical protein